jgi:putative 4-mercaptohistidine N1-methyltranferase
MQNPYETDELLNQYLGFHYGDSYFGVENYAAHCARLCLQYMDGRTVKTALDLGCAVGRSAFELASVFEQVTAVDLSERFIDTCVRLQRGETLNYWLQDEGKIGQSQSVSLQQTPLRAHADRVRFVQGDACVQGPGEPLADLVFAGNLIDRVAKPAAFLKGLAHRVARGGLLVISSPYTLLPDYTHPDDWIGGTVTNGSPVTMRQGMEALLSPAFRLLGEPRDVPFVIRETARKYQHSIAQMTVWERSHS